MRASIIPRHSPEPTRTSTAATVGRPSLQRSISTLVSVLLTLFLLGVPVATANPPAAIPTGLHVTSVTATTISVAWDASPDSALAPVVFFDDTERYRDWLRVDYTGWTLYDLTCGTPHTIGVAYVYNEGDLSEVGAVSWVPASTSPCTGPAPAAPAGLHVIDATWGTLTVGWNAPSDADVDRVKVDVFGPPFLGVSGNYVPPAIYESGFTMNGGVCGTDYRFEVIFRDAEGQYSPSASLTAATESCDSFGPPPAGPLELRVTSATSTTANLAWDPPDPFEGVTHVRLTVSGPTVREYWKSKTSTTAAIATPKCGSTYTAALSWLFDDGLLSAPATVTLTTPACPPPPVRPAPPPQVPQSAPTTPSVPAAPIPKLPPTFTATTAYALPSSRTCLRRPPRLTLTYRRPRNVTVDRLEVWVGKRLITRLTGSKARRSLTLKRLPTKQFTLRLKVTPHGGKTVTSTRTYRVCR